ncbi:chalcone-flavanone isomerase-domain-containing protein [Dactylonectria macrodidyma]|uniref:Chalcone-flavanone isomerase-domain-containing protein n=1 Tax=Dactylonectria macrodidyma TaxID=307937 RepID=A0A9P9F420_9HYPO|nr:chalcone-flavanone isomerase-domain-containing protein [Dactylonectria macrodidyma]
MLRPSTLRPALRAQRTQCAAVLHASRRTMFSQRQSRLTDDFDVNQLNSKRRDYEQNRTAFLAAGAIAGIVSFCYTAWKLKEALDLQSEKEKRAVKCDGPVPADAFKTEAGEKRKVVLHDDEGRELVPTGNSTVKLFPRTLVVDDLIPAQGSEHSLAASLSDKQGTEFTLVGLGTRTVTFLSIQVYVIGFYVATQDIAKLQNYLVKKINPLATTLIPSEKEALRKALQDATESEETWNTAFRESGCGTAFRITPVRDTDFPHLRDAMVRAITARSAHKDEYKDEAFGEAVKTFKRIFQRGLIPREKELLMVRDSAGKLSIIYDGGDKYAPKKSVLGTVDDERLSRLLWLNYLGGKKVASEQARQNIIDGIMEFVERPIGTVATQVVVAQPL